MTRETTAQAIKRMQDAYEAATSQYEKQLAGAIDQFQAMLDESVQKMANMVSEAAPEPPKKPECQWVEIEGEKHLLMTETGADLIYKTLAGMNEVIQEMQQMERRNKL